MKEKEITHNGTITAINEGILSVTVEANSACSGCHAKGACSMSEQSEKIISVNSSDYLGFNVGDQVIVVLSQESGIFAVLAAYIFPVILFILSLMISDWAGVEELYSFFYTLGLVAIYYIILYLLRKKITTKINIKIKR